MKSTIALALLLLTTTTVMGEYAKTKFYKAGFQQTPKVVIDTSTDKLFDGALANTLFYSAGDSADTLYAWKINWDIPSNSSTSIIKRTLDASTFKAKGNDITLNLKIKSKMGLIGQPAPGYIGFPAIRDSGKGTADQLYFSILPATATRATELNEVMVASNRDTTTGMYVNSVWFTDNYYWIMYTQFDMKKGYEKALYLQAIKTDGTLMYNAPIKVASLNNPPGTTIPIAGPNKDSNPTMIYVVYKDSNSKATVQTTVKISNGYVDEPTKLVSDSETQMYFPDGMISASKVFGVVLNRQQMVRKQFSEDLRVYYNGATSKPSILDLDVPKGYQNPIIQSFPHPGGFVILGQLTGEKDALIVIKIFNANGTEKVAQKTIANTQGAMLFFRDAAGTVWLGYNDFDMKDGKVAKGYLGKLISA